MMTADWRDLADQSAGPDACWPTVGGVNTDGYATAWFADLRQTSPVARVALAVTLGRPIAPGMYACHTCDNRRCINPAHIYEGTPQQNGRDKAERGRARNGYTKAVLGSVFIDGAAQQRRSS